MEHKVRLDLAAHDRSLKSRHKHFGSFLEEGGQVGQLEEMAVAWETKFKSQKHHPRCER